MLSFYHVLRALDHVNMTVCMQLENVGVYV